MITEKKCLLHLFVAFFLLASALLTQPAPVYAQGWLSSSADVDGDGLPNVVEDNGWYNAIGGPYVTNYLDADSDGDGLTDGQEKLYDTDPWNDKSPGIYVEYENHLKTRQYFAKDPHSVQPWGWQQYGDRFISFDAVVVRRGATFYVGGPADATIQIEKSLSSLTTLEPVRDACAGRWRIYVPSGGTVGKYQITLQEGGWSESLNLYVIFELPTPSSSLTQAMIDAFLYDDDPDNLRDEIGVELGVSEYTHTDTDYSWIPAGTWVTAGYGYRFELQPFEPFVFEEHVMEAINGRDSQWNAARDLVAHADKVTRFAYPRWLNSSWKVLHTNPNNGNQCSNIAGLLTAFERSAGIPARPFFVDWRHRSFDHSAEVWLRNPDTGTTTWWAARGYNVSGPEPEGCVLGADGCGDDGVLGCSCGHKLPRSRSSWGYNPWHSHGGGIGNVVAAADENWVWGQLEPWTVEGQHEYRWPSWDWDGIVRKGWFDTLFVPYWKNWGWTQEPQITGIPPGDWPAVTDFTIDVSPDSRTVARGNSTNYTVILDTSDGFSNDVDLSIVSGLPAGTAFSFQPDSYCVPNCSRTLVMTPAITTPIGTHHPTIRGYSGGLDRSETVELVITAPPDFAISAAPPSQTVAPSGSADYTVSVEALNGFADIVNLSVTGLPISSTETFIPSAGVGPPYDDTTLRITTAGTPTGTHATLTIHGNSGALHHQTTVDLDVGEGGALGGQATSGPSLVATSPSVGAMSDGSQAGLTVGGLQDYGLDLDGDGYFDQLVVEIEVNAMQPGTYWFQTDLGADHQVPTLIGTGGLIAAAVVRADLAEGTNTVQLPFDGLHISAAKVDGPYILKYLSITDVDNPTPEDFANSALGHWRSLYTTAAYQADDFQNRGAVLSGSYSHYDLDSDGNGRADALVVTTGINVYQPGSYTVEGSLYNSQDGFIAYATWTGTGPEVTLQFDHVAGTLGPYTLRDLDLLDAEGESIDYIAEAYTIEPISALGIPELVSLDVYPVGDGLIALGETITPTHVFTESLIAGNLQVEAEVQVSEAGSYKLEAWLTDVDSNLVTWALSQPTDLSVGVQVLSVTFDGSAIHTHGVDGPYTVVALKVLDGEADYEVLDEVDIALTTQAYTLNQFANLGATNTNTNIVFEDDMESGSSQWAASPWSLTFGTSRSPTHSWADSPSGDYGNNVNMSLTTHSISVSEPELNQAVVMFQGCYDLKANDYGYVEIQVNGGAWNTVLTFTGGTELWYSGKAGLHSDDEITSLKARFRLSSDGSETADGWYIDDVIITVGEGTYIYLPVIMK
jgi:hypothetical protein